MDDIEQFRINIFKGNILSLVLKSGITYSFQHRNNRFEFRVTGKLTRIFFSFSEFYEHYQSVKKVFENECKSTGN